MTTSRLHVGLVACSGPKADRALPARELYVSPLFRAARAYAERHYGHGQWFILSAQYGLVDPDRVLAPYDLSLRRLTAAQRASWGNRIAVELTDRWPAGTVLWFYAGAQYREAIAPLVAHQVRFPLAGLRIGEQLAWYRRRLSAEPSTAHRPEDAPRYRERFHEHDYHHHHDEVHTMSNHHPEPGTLICIDEPDHGSLEDPLRA